MPLPVVPVPVTRMQAPALIELASAVCVCWYLVELVTMTLLSPLKPLMSRVAPVWLTS